MTEGSSSSSALPIRTALPISSSPLTNSSSAPQHLAHMTLPFMTTNHMWNSRFSQYDGDSVVPLGRQLVFQRPVEDESEQRYVEVVDFSDPSNPSHIESITLSADRSGALFRAGDVVLSSRLGPTLRRDILATRGNDVITRSRYPAMVDPYNTSRPETPELLEQAQTNGHLSDVLILDDGTVVLADDFGLQFLPVTWVP